MKWCSALSSAPETSPALDEVVERVREELGGAAPHFVLAFLSPHHDFQKASDALGAAFPDAAILGTSARSVIGAGRELEEEPGLALATAHLPGVEIHPFHLRNDELPAPGEAPAWWRERLGLAHGVRPSFVLLADPFSCDAETLIGGLDASFPGAPKIGGLASAATEPGGNSLLCAGRLERGGGGGGGGPGGGGGGRGAPRRAGGGHDRRPGLPSHRKPPLRHARARPAPLRARRAQARGRPPGDLRRGGRARPRALPHLALPRHRDEGGPLRVSPGRLPGAQPRRPRRAERRARRGRAAAQRTGGAVPSARRGDLGARPRGAARALPEQP